MPYIQTQLSCYCPNFFYQDLFRPNLKLYNGLGTFCKISRGWRRQIYLHQKKKKTNIWTVRSKVTDELDPFRPVNHDHTRMTREDVVNLNDQSGPQMEELMLKLSLVIDISSHPYKSISKNHAWDWLFKNDKGIINWMTCHHKLTS